jgi:DNA-binding response OmpR family regulator
MVRILLVEDDPDVRPILELVLREAGYEVDAVVTVAAAKALLDSQPYDLVVTDGRLPDGHGVQVADKAAAMGIPRFILTGYLFQSSPADLRRHEHLMKPVRPSELVDAVHRVLRKPRT